MATFVLLNLVNVVLISDLVRSSTTTSHPDSLLGRLRCVVRRFSCYRLIVTLVVLAQLCLLLFRGLFPSLETLSTNWCLLYATAMAWSIGFSHEFFEHGFLRFDAIHVCRKDSACILPTLAQHLCYAP